MSEAVVILQARYPPSVWWKDGRSSKHAHDDVNVIMSMACNAKQSLRLMRNSAEQYFLLALHLYVCIV